MKYLWLLALVCVLAACAQASDPAEDNASGNGNLTVAQYYPCVGAANDLQVTDNYIYVTEGQAGFSIWDRNTGSLLSRQDQIGNEYFYNLTKLCVVEGADRLFMSNETPSERRINAINIADKTAPRNLLAIQGETTAVSCMQFSPNTITYPDLSPQSEEDAYTSMGAYINNTSFATLRLLVYGTSGNTYFEYRLPVVRASGLANDGNNYYVAAEENGLLICTISGTLPDHLAGNVVGRADTPGEALDVCKNGDVIYVADRQAGLQVVDITNPASPALLRDKAQETSGYAQNVSCDGNLLAVASGAGGVYVYDVGIPDSPKLIGRLNSDSVGYVYAVDVAGNDIYAASRDFGVCKINVTR